MRLVLQKGFILTALVSLAALFTYYSCRSSSFPSESDRSFDTSQDRGSADTLEFPSPVGDAGTGMNSSLDVGTNGDDFDDRGSDVDLDIGLEDTIDAGSDAGIDVIDGASLDTSDADQDPRSIVSDANEYSDVTKDTGPQDAGVNAGDVGLPDPCEAINARTDIACLKTILACFDGSGNCTTSVSGVLVIVTASKWENGASIDMTFVDDQRTNGKALSADGNTCFTFDDFADVSGETTTTYHAEGESVKILVRNDGSTQVTCDNGAVVELSTDLNPDLCLPNVYSIVAMCSME